MAPRLLVLTQNLYLGASLYPVFLARDRAELLAAAERAVVDLEESDPRGRCGAVAALIELARPDIVGLQEAAVWREGDRVLADLAALVLQALDGRYQLAGRWSAARAALPPELGGRSVELGNAVLVRRGLTVEASSGEYQSRLTIPHPLLGEVHLRRGWVAVDGELEGRPFRVVDTHLEATEPVLPAAVAVQLAQAEELAAGPAAVAPVIVVGDLNSDDAARGVNRTESRNNLVRAGFTDAWTELRPGEPGLTWRLGDEIAREDAELGARLDLVLTRGAVRAIKIERLGQDPSARTPSGRWPSDHLALAATLELG